jgi:hypothetical protein
MKEYLTHLIKESGPVLDGKNIVREYLQARILSTLQKCGAMIPLSFHGGTALRFLYAHGRYSEDLDFALEGQKNDYAFLNYLKAVQTDLKAEGYPINVKANEKNIVNNAYFRFPGLLHELGLSPMPSETLSIKIEVDTNPPKGAVCQTTVVRRFVVLQLHHHDKASLLAGKLHAILQRPYSKGRDLFDLLWYLSDPAWPEPNFVLLNNALHQSEWTGEPMNENNWKVQVVAKLQTLNWEEVRRDVLPFVPGSFNLGLLQLNTFKSLLDK